MKSVKVMYVAAFFAVAAVFALFEYGVLPPALIPDTPENRYVVDVVGALTGFGGVVLIFSFMKLPFVRRAVEQEDAARALKARARYARLRIAAWLVLMIINVVLYYEAPMTSNPTYQVLVLFIAGVFCWPAEERGGGKA